MPLSSVLKDSTPPSGLHGSWRTDAWTDRHTQIINEILKRKMRVDILLMVYGAPGLWSLWGVVCGLCISYFAEIKYCEQKQLQRCRGLQCQGRHGMVAGAESWQNRSLSIQEAECVNSQSGEAVSCLSPPCSDTLPPARVHVLKKMFHNLPRQCHQLLGTKCSIHGGWEGCIANSDHHRWRGGWFRNQTLLDTRGPTVLIWELKLSFKATVMVPAFKTGTWWVKPQGISSQGHPWLQSDCESSPGGQSPSLEKNKQLWPW